MDISLVAVERECSKTSSKIRGGKGYLVELQGWTQQLWRQKDVAVLGRDKALHGILLSPRRSSSAFRSLPASMLVLGPSAGVVRLFMMRGIQVLEACMHGQTIARAYAMTWAWGWLVIGG